MQVAEHDAYGERIAGKVVEGGLGEISGVDFGDDLPPTTTASESRIVMIAGAVIVAISILAVSVLLD